MKDLLKCSFCGRNQRQVAKLIAGPGVYVCNECIGLCNQILSDEFSPEELAAGVRGAAPAQGTPENLPRSTSPSHPGSSETVVADLIRDLEIASQAHRPVEDHIQKTVMKLREQSVSWGRIGEALGVSRQAAWSRYSGEE